MRDASATMATNEGLNAVPRWLTAILVTAPMAAWVGLLVAGTVVVGPSVLYSVLGAYLLGICLALAFTAHRHTRARKPVDAARR